MLHSTFNCMFVPKYSNEFIPDFFFKLLYNSSSGIKCTKGWGPIAKLLPLDDSFLLSTNEKLLFFFQTHSTGPQTLLSYSDFFNRVTGNEILTKSSVSGPVEWQQLCNWSPALKNQEARSQCRQ